MTFTLETLKEHSDLNYIKSLPISLYFKWDDVLTGMIEKDQAVFIKSLDKKTYKGILNTAVKLDFVQNYLSVFKNKLIIKSWASVEKETEEKKTSLKFTEVNVLLPGHTPNALKDKLKNLNSIAELDGASVKLDLTRLEILTD